MARRSLTKKPPNPHAGHTALVELTLVEMPGGFAGHDGFNDQWWRPRVFAGDATFLSAVDEHGGEVARVEMVERTYPGEYVGVTESPDFIKIQLVEVHGRLRRRGVGSTILELLAERYTNRRLLAFSEADAFWDRTGWNRHIHRDDDPARPRHQALYIHPR